VGKRLDIGGGGGGGAGDVGEGEGGEGGGGEGGGGGDDGVVGDVGDVGVAGVVGVVGDVGEVGEGEGGEGGDDVPPVVMLRWFCRSAPRILSGVAVSDSPGGEADLRAVEATFPLLLATTADLWLARVAIMAAFTRFMGRGLALSVRGRSRVGGGS